MGRILRLDFPDTTYHVYARGVRREPLFHDDEDRHQFLEYLGRTKRRNPFDLLSYTMLTNHYHMEVKTKTEKLASIMHHLNLQFAGFYNYRYGQKGHVFESRYNSIIVQGGSYLLRLSRYIDLNAPKAGIVQRPEDYPWCSYPAMIGKRSDPLLDPQLILDTLDPSTARQRQSYREFVEEGLRIEAEFKESQLRKMRVYGSDQFHADTYGRAKGAGLNPTYERQPGLLLL